MLSEILQKLIDEMFYNLSKPEVQNYKSKYTKISFIKEFCTIKLGTHRRAGHTTAAWSLNLRQKYNILYVIKNKKAYKDYITTNSNVIEFVDNFDFYTNFENLIISKKINVIIIDPSFYLSDSITKQIINNLPIEHGNIILVLLQ